MRGRRPKPTATKLLMGNPGRHPLNREEPAPPIPAVCPAPPEYLVGWALKTWRRLAPQLHVLKILTDLDVDALGCLCQAIEDHRRATITLRREQRYAQTLSGAMQAHPAAAAQQQAAIRIRAFAVEFGLTPSARVRIHTPTQKPADDDPVRWRTGPKGWNIGG